MKDLMVFNEFDELLCIASNQTKDSLHYWDADFEESLNQVSTFEFCCLPDHENSVHIVAKNQVAFFDKDGFLRLFSIEAVEQEIDMQGERIRARCIDPVVELSKSILPDIRPQNVTLRFALERALSRQSRWQVGEVADRGIKSTNFFYISALDAVVKCLRTWTAELRARVETDGQRITGRYIDAISRGRDTGLQMEVGHNVDGLNLTIETGHIRTLFIGRGAGIPLYDDTGTATGGFSRRIMFEELTATEASHGFVKPRGQPFVTDERAREIFGLVNPQTGAREHLEGVFESQDENPDTLMRRTWEHLQENNRPFYNAKCDLVLLAELLGEAFDHEQLRIGDVVRLVDHETFKTPIAVSTRVIAYKYDLTYPESATVELGDFRNLYADRERLSNIEHGLNNGQWQRPSVVGPGNIANVIPEQVTGFEAFGGFSQIHLFWNHQGLLVRDFELHGSEVEDFIPEDSNLIHRGPVSAYSHHVEPNRRWYYRCRAVNYHNMPGDWSIQVHAQTANTFGLDQLEEKLEELNEVQIPHLRGLVEEWQYLDTVEIDGATIRARTVQALSIEAGGITALEIAADTITANNLAINTITADRIASNAIVARHIIAGAIVADHIAAGAITSNHINVGTLNGNVIQSNSIHGNRITAHTITADQIAAGTITANLIRANTITANQIAANTITAGQIAANTITATQIAANTITATQIAANTITGNRIAANTITANHLVADAIQVGFNALGDTLHLTPTTLSFFNGDIEAGRLTARGMEFWHHQRGLLGQVPRELGRMGHQAMANHPDVRGIAIRTAFRGDFISFSYHATSTASASTTMAYFDPHGRRSELDGARRPGLHIPSATRLFIRNFGTRQTTRLDYSIFTMSVGGQNRVFIGTDATTATRTGIAFGAGQVYVVRNNVAARL